MSVNNEHDQMVICNKYNVEYFPAPFHLKIGIALNVCKGIIPINGLRHPPTSDTLRWYIWAGEEFSEKMIFLTIACGTSYRMVS